MAERRRSSRLILGHTPLLVGCEHPELVFGWHIVATIAFVENGTFDDVTNERLHVWDDSFASDQRTGARVEQELSTRLAASNLPA